MVRRYYKTLCLGGFCLTHPSCHHFSFQILSALEISLYHFVFLHLLTAHNSGINANIVKEVSDLRKYL